MDERRAEAQQLIERYAQDRLRGEELRAFEEYMFDHPEVLEDIEYARGLTAALRDNESMLFQPAGSSIAASGTSSASWARPLAIAASCLLAVSLATNAQLFRLNQLQDAQIVEGLAPRLIDGAIYLDRTRGTREFIVGVENESIILRLPLDEQTLGNAYLRQDLTLRVRKIGDKDYLLNALVSSEGREWADIHFPAPEAGSYLLELEPTNSELSPLRFSFEVDAE